MDFETVDQQSVVSEIEALADEMLEVSAAVSGCGEAVACKACSARLIASASRYRSAAGKLKGTQIAGV